MRTKLTRLLCALALSFGGCAGSTVGLQKDGNYVLASDEHSLDCQRIQNSIWGRLQVMKAMPEKAREERQNAPPTAPPTASLAWGRMFGGKGDGLATVKDYDREHAHVRALHRKALDTGCPPIEVERELAQIDALMAQYRKP